MLIGFTVADASNKFTVIGEWIVVDAGSQTSDQSIAEESDTEVARDKQKAKDLSTSSVAITRKTPREHSSQESSKRRCPIGVALCLVYDMIDLTRVSSFDPIDSLVSDKRSQREPSRLCDDCEI